MIGEKIKKVRELRNYTQEYMAEKLRMSQAGYSKLETGESDISYTKLSQVAEVLEMKVEDLVSFDEKVVFNIMYNKQAVTGYIVNNTISDEMKKLYEDKIKLLEGKVELLEKLYGK
ncbi:MAG: helix-turn-helix domain-containing protein [Cytophagales bacterium]|nr:helix-turn-helix domain-containing protein [Cytophagales bacterium]